MISTSLKSLIPAISPSVLRGEVANLGAECFLLARGDFEVYLASAEQIPQILQEIGRLREMTFRSVGEGTGKALDIDDFDQHYLNLFIWDKIACKIVGGYRMGMGASILDANRIENFYIHSLFEVDPQFYPTLARSIELGRSYIIPEYQKGYLPFFLLWRGILEVLIKNEQYQFLIGPVSISKYYSGVSKGLIVEFVKRFFYDEQTSAFFKPRTPFKTSLTSYNIDELLKNVNGQEIKDLENFLSKLEPEHIKVPVLLKQYTRLNAKFISFNIDPNFSDALDGLMLLNLENLPKETLQLLNEK